MDMFATLRQYLDNQSKPVDPQWVESMAAAYPYFTLPATLLLSRDTSHATPEQLQAIAARLTINTPDPAALLPVVNSDAAQWIGIYPPENPLPTVTTDEAIRRFMSTYGRPEPNEDAVLERLIFNPTPDYAQILAQEEEDSQPLPGEAPTGSNDDLINRFIIKTRENQGHFPSTTEEEKPAATPAATTSEPVAAPEVADNSSLSESLAKVYISQKRYDKAYEIILSLSLNYPEKSIYFADQLRFLQKLIRNQRHIDKKSTK